MELEHCCRGLESSKVTERSKSIKQILSLLQNPEILKAIKDGNTSSWDNIIFSLYLCLMNDAQKYAEDIKKKNATTVTYELNGKIFFDVVVTAIKEDKELDYSNFLNYVKNFLERKIMKQLYGKTCLVTMKDHILLNPRFRSNLKSSDWSELLSTLKEACESPETLQDSNYTQIECVSLVLKWGPLYSLAPDVLREEFKFVMKVCKSVRQSSLRPHKEIILTLAYEFCQHMAKDNRFVCCNLGEELLLHFIELYEINVREDKLKVQLIDFFLLQTILHHPKGAPENHPASFACDWKIWNNYLRLIYWQLCKEIDYNMKCRNKNGILFLTSVDNRQELSENFINLFIEICKQVFNKANQDVSTATVLNNSFENPVFKRQKSDMSLRSLIENVDQTKNWPWIQIIYSLLKIYPETIDENDYFFLLETMRNLLNESHDQDLRHHVYKCLKILKEIVPLSVGTPTGNAIFIIWKAIAEITLKEIGLHISSDIAENLLHLLLSDANVIQNENILKMLHSSSNFTSSRIKSLYFYGKAYDFPKSNNNKIKIDIINNILNSDDMKKIDFYADALTAKVLFNFVLKHWFSQDDLPETNSSEGRPHNEISDIYFQTCFEDVLVSFEMQQEIKVFSQIPLVDIKMKQLMLNRLSEIVKKIIDDEDVELHIILNTMILLKNIISQFSIYKVLSSERTELCASVKALLNHFTIVFSKSLKIGESLMKKLIPNLQLLYRFIVENEDPFAVSEIISFVSEDLLKILFGILHENSKRRYNTANEVEFQLTLQTVKVISAYCFVSGETKRTETQMHAFEAAVNFEYDLEQEYEYILAKTFLVPLKECKLRDFEEDSLNLLLNFMKNICYVRYTFYDAAYEILENFKLILSYLKLNFSENNLKDILNLIEPFYSRRSNYGPRISKLIIECLDLACQIDTQHGLFKKWIDDELVIVLIAEFLCSDYQEVRLSAIRSISKFYSSEKPAAVHIQKELFKKIFQLSLQVFEIQGNISEERKIDEDVTRSASVLQTFAALALSNGIWMQESLFASIRITHMKKLSILEKILSVFAKHFNTKNQLEVLEDSLEYILNRWEDFRYSLDLFPFSLFNCSDKPNFIQKYMLNSIYFLIKHDDEDVLKVILPVINKDMSTLYRDYAPKIFSRCIISEGTDNLKYIYTKNAVLAKLIKVLGVNVFKQTIKDNVEDVLFELLININDQEHFEKHLNTTSVFSMSPGRSLSVEQFEILLKFLENDIFNVDNVLGYLMQDEPNKLHELTLKLKLKLQQVKVDKNKIFHGYFTIISLIIKTLNQNFAYHDYFIQDTIMYLLNLMSNLTVDEKLRIIASRTFYIFVKNILPTFSNNISPFFAIIVHKLINLSTYSEILSDDCVDALKILIIQNANEFSPSIEMLDPFPSGVKFEQLREVHLDIRERNRNITLKREIENFLKCGQETKYSNSREEGLKHLLKQLTARKQELYELRSQLTETRGFSEDCQKGVLHQLIIMLFELTKSKNTNVTTEAGRCLGELGALNLNTLILKPERRIESHNLTPSELICGQIISHLTHYTTDQDLDLVAASSEALYQVLSNRESRKISRSNEEFINGKIQLNYLYPFISSTKAKADCQLRIDENALVRGLNDDELWCPSENTLHEDWIRKLVSRLLETFSEKCFLSKLTQICQHKVEFCEEMLPYIVHMILTMCKKQMNDFIICKINFFFENHWRKAVSLSNQHDGSTVMNISSLKTMLNCVHYIRLQTINSASQRSNKNSIDLNLNYLHLAQAAQYCSQHFAAILYVEVWCQMKFQEIIDSSPPDSQKHLPNSKMLTVVYEHIDPQSSRAVEDILRGSYKALGELDALNGCGTTMFLDPSRRIEHYKDLGKWNHALVYHEIELSLAPSSTNSSKSLIDSLKHCSLYELPILYNDAQLEYECLWRLGRWNTDDFKDNRTRTTTQHDEFEKRRYLALKFLHEKDSYNLQKAVNDGMLYEIDKMKQLSLESYHNLYGVLAELQSLREIETFSQMNSKENINALVRLWQMQDEHLVDDFECIEPIKSQRVIMLKEKFETFDNKEALVDLSLNLVQYSRLENHLNAATRTLYNLRACENLSDEAQCYIKFEDAQLCWALNDKTSAHHLLRHLCNNRQVDPRVRSSSLKLAGKWLIESLSENKNTIITDYLLASVNIYKDLPDRNTQDVENIYDAYDEIGRFSDKEYQQIMSHMNSDMFQQKTKNMEKLKQAANDLRGGVGRRKLTIDENKAARIHEQQSAIDEREIENAKSEKKMFLKLALKYHLSNLIYSDKNNNRIFRVISLFFENRTNQDISEIVTTYIPKIPTYKYITILPQIVPHLSSNNENIFVEHINSIIEKCVRDHPHHTLPLILNLKYSNKDKEFSSSTTKTSTNDTRISSAIQLIDKMKETDLSDIIIKMELLSEALIQLAYYQPTATREKQKEYSIPASYKITKVKRFSNVLVPTCNLQVSKSSSYHNLIGIDSFGSSYKTVGGINAPKRITCRGTDGKVRSQLLKGQDDLRQDAVMQQVFTIMNNLLHSNKNTNNLRVRTYKIVPLSMRSGILEWVDNSMPIGTYLVGDKEEDIVGAHVMYRPNDMNPKQCRSEFSKCAHSTVDKKLKAYNEICGKFKPVLHKFFEHTFPQPSVWYERHRAYIYSVATSSMCGYILGIGDRHVQNILIDKSTAEVIHIDFGIAFEQGRCLPTPETIPFRLTRDIIDGMGVCGVEGIFRKSCEKTMEVMRQNSQTILTIVEVLLYDPLYTWAVTTAEANKRQKRGQDETDNELSGTSSSENVSINITAERALMRLKSKLLGTENGYPVSLEHQVGTLIQQAQDPANLCRLFQGWQPYL